MAAYRFREFGCSRLVKLTELWNTLPLIANECERRSKGRSECPQWDMMWRWADHLAAGRRGRLEGCRAGTRAALPGG